ncbi:MAG: nucleotide sugar dehydrogenase [Hyphomicrobiaceae bacterium]
MLVAGAQTRSEVGGVEHVAEVPSVAVDKPSISVVGLGYVGAVSMACLARLGFRMVGVDISEVRVNAIRAGRSPIVEDQLDVLLQEGCQKGLITASHNLVGAVLMTDVTFMSVGTPTAADGSCDLTYVRDASRAIGEALKVKSRYHVVVMRCSVPPGTTLGTVVPEIEAASGKKLGEDFGICFNPEFLREGVAVNDFFNPPKTVIGASDERAEKVVKGIYSAIDEKVVYTTIAAAEMVKYADNVWHATKVAFGNEIGRICKALEIDSHDVMNIFVKDQKLNLSPYYLKPGFAFGGSCLPKEVRAVGHLADELGVDTPLVKSLIPTNRAHVDLAYRLLQDYKGKRIGFMGVTFKPATDDLRESPTLDLMATLMADGEEIWAYDPNLRFGPHLKAQISYVRHSSPHLAEVVDRLEQITVVSAPALAKLCDVIVVSHATEEFRTAVRGRPHHVHVLDLARVFKDLPEDATYQGIAW